MTTEFKDNKEIILSKLNKLGAIKPCPRCENTKFTLIDGYHLLAVQDNLEGFVLGGAGVPVALVACNRCGFISQHALGVLGILPIDSEKENGE